MSNEHKMLRIVAKREDFRRAGRIFGSTPVDIPLSSLTSRLLHELKHDPMLVCHEMNASTEDELKALREKAALADAFLATLPNDYIWSTCPSEYVTDLQGELRKQTELAVSLTGELNVVKAKAIDLHASAPKTGKPAGHR